MPRPTHPPHDTIWMNRLYSGDGDKGVIMVAINKLWIPPDIAFHGDQWQPRRLDNLAQQTDMRPPFMHLGSSHNYSVEQLFKAQLINLIKARK